MRPSHLIKFGILMVCVALAWFVLRNGISSHLQPQDSLASKRVESRSPELGSDGGTKSLIERKSQSTTLQSAVERKNITTPKTVEIRKGILLNGVATDVEIKALEPAVYVGLRVDSQGLAEIDRVKELRAFARIKHVEHLSMNDYKALACRSAQSELTAEVFEACVRDEQTHPERHHIWVRYFVFITQGDLKALFICYNFEDKAPSGSLVASPYIWEDGAWKAWAADFEKQNEFSHAFNLTSPNNPGLLFKEGK